MRLWVVEDEHKIANSLKIGLKQGGFVVDVAYGSRTGFDLASTENYGALILDLILPGKDGLTICQELRTAGNHTPILVLTACGEIKDKVAELNAGADNYLVKLFAFEELPTRVRALVRRPQKTAEAVSTYHELSLNPVTFSAKLKN